MEKENQSSARFLNPYLSFPGTAEEAFNFYSKILGGEIITLQKFKDTPHGPEIPKEDKEKVMHVSLKLNDGTLLMASDNLPSMRMPLIKGNDMSLSLSPSSREEADRLYNALSDGGSATMAMQDTFWNAYFGMLTDKFGIQWMINFSHPEEKK
jgi:PhnB protein